MDSSDAVQQQRTSNPDQDKSLYKVGDLTSTGQKIARMVGSTRNHVIYTSDSSGAIGWEIANAAPYKSALAKAVQLMGAVEELPPILAPVAHNMVGQALHLALSAEEGTDVDPLFERAETYISKMTDDIERRIGSGPDFLIYKNKKGDICWSHRSLPEHLSLAMEEYQALGALVDNVLPKESKKAATEMLGAALMALFQKKEGDDLMTVLKGPREFIYSQAAAYHKIKFFVISFLSLISTVLLLMIFVALLGLPEMFAAVAGAGVFGAMVSALQRSSLIPESPYGSKLALPSEVVSRLIIGAIFGLFVVFCAKSEIALAPFKDNGYALICFAFIAGFSERFVPNLISTVSDRTDK